MTNESGLAEAWRVNATITQRLLEAIPAEGLEASYTKRTRTVRAQFQHMHYVRVQNLEKRGGGTPEDVPVFAKGAEPGKDELLTALEASGEALADLMGTFERAGEVKSWGGRPPATYLGYFVSHESHHRGLAIVALRFAGIKLPSSTLMGELWYSWRKAQD